MIGVSHIWSAKLKKTALISTHAVDVTLLVSKSEGTDGSIHWWGQVMFGNKIAGAVGGPGLTGHRLMAIGSPQELGNYMVLEPRAIVDFK